MRTFLLLINLLVCFVATSQTTLERGDIMVLGVNVNNHPCDNTSTDLFHLVFLKEIEKDTEFYFTDNPWTGTTPPFRRNEGVVLVKRTGTDLPAGSIVPIKMTDLGTGGNENQASGNGVSLGWSITRVGNGSSVPGNPFALPNSGGDQIIFWQGTWDSENPGNFTGNLLLAYNTKRSWDNAISPNDSRLPSDLACYHISSPSNSNSNFAYYNGLTTGNLSKGEWNVRILSNINWTNASSGCLVYNSNVSTGTLQVRTSEVQEICSGESLLNLTVVSQSNVSYKWYRNEIESTSGTPTQVGLNSNIYTPSNTLIGTYFYYCVMTINVPATINGSVANNTCEFVSNFFKVTVNPNPITSPVLPL